MQLSNSAASALIGSITGIITVLLIHSLSYPLLNSRARTHKGSQRGSKPAAGTGARQPDSGSGSSNSNGRGNDCAAGDASQDTDTDTIRILSITPTSQSSTTSTTSKINSPTRSGKRGNLDGVPDLEPLDSLSMTPILSRIRQHSLSLNTRIPTLVVGIAGGSGSGKTTLADAIFTALGRENNVTFISHDSYYKDLSHWSMEKREKQNFDHPDSLDTNLLIEHVKKLRRGEEASIPVYDFSTHSRTKEKTTVVPRKVVLVEGILIFTEQELADLLDVKIFVDTESDVRLMRRIQRDCQERGE